MRRHSSTTIAKLTSPRLQNVVERGRLLVALDASSRRQCIWVSGPPGSGKTTLVARYLALQDRPVQWYQVDGGDNDPATFYFYLHEAVAAAPRSRSSPRLALFTPEYRADGTGFARRFFREAFRALGPRCVLVFDNYQELAPSSELHAALAACLEEVPAGCNLVIVSRFEPPAAYARALINGHIARLDWDTLKLTETETGAVARARGVSDAATIKSLHEESCGWMAGTVLMAERIAQTGNVDRPDRTGPLETVFDYFADQILAAVPSETRDVLIRTGLLPHVTAEAAEAVTGQRNAIAQVALMHRRQLFTDHVQSTAASYRYHGLFHEFLRNRARQHLSPALRIELCESAAAQFEKSGDLENAFLLFVDTGNWAEAERLLVARAPTLIAQGRWRTVQEWHDRLPEARREANPWVTYWLGRSLSPVDPRAAQRCFEAGWGRFSLLGEPRGALLCGIGILEALYFLYEEFGGMDLWIDRATRQLESKVSLAGPDEELWVEAVFLMACSYRAPGHPRPGRAVARVQELLPIVTDVNLKVTAATMLHFWGYVALDRQATATATREARPLLGSDRLTAQRAAMYIGEEGYSHYAYGRYPEALRCFDESEAIGELHGLIEICERVGQWRGFCQRRAGLLDEASATIRRLEERWRNREGACAVHLDLLRAYVAFDRNDQERALELALPAEEKCERVGLPITFALMLIINGQMLAAARKFDLSDRSLERALALVQDTALIHQKASIVLTLAWNRQLQGRFEEAKALVRELLELCHGERERTCLLWYPHILSNVLAFALERGIDPHAVQRLAIDCRVQVPTLAANVRRPHVKIWTLGRFVVTVNDQPLAFLRKTPKRVLTLLKVLVACGGNNVPEEDIVDAIWPDLDGDAAHKALGALVLRLRRLLGGNDVLHKRDGKLSINPDCCWIDVQEFARCSLAADPSALEIALDLYKGPFLPHDAHEFWTADMRERHRNRYAEAVALKAAPLEQSARFAEAARCYSQAIELDALAEPLHVALMRCHMRLGQVTEAIQVYTRLDKILTARTGSPPSRPAQHLYHSLLSGHGDRP